MTTVYNLHNAFKRSQIEICSNASYDLLLEYLMPYYKEKLPESVAYKVATGGKYDHIRLFQSGEFFFSQKLLLYLPRMQRMEEISLSV